MRCPTCLDVREITRYVSNGYDLPVYRVKAACPTCRPTPAPSGERRMPAGPRPFFIIPPKERQ